MTLFAAKRDAALLDTRHKDGLFPNWTSKNARTVRGWAKGVNSKNKQ
jgi:hypothetical protein